MLQFITDSKSSKSYEQQINDALDGGCRWIQIRLHENFNEDDTRALVEKIMPRCLETESFLILEDNIDLAKELNVGGVFLRNNPTSPSKARATLGAAAVVGAYINSLEDAEKVRYFDIDYLATSGAADSEQPIDIENIKAICSAMRDKEITLPLVAIGKISLDQVAAVTEAGAQGIAVSEAIVESVDPIKTTQDFINAIPKTGNK